MTAMDTITTFRIVLFTLGGFSSILCLAAIVLVFVLKLHRNVLYRLTVYQVFTAMMFGGVLIANSLANSTVLAGVSYYVGWVKVLFAFCLTVHLFALVVYHKNLKRFELAFIATSLFVPLPFGFVPSLLFNPQSNYTTASFHRMMEVIYSPGIAIAFFVSLVSVYVGVILCWRVRRANYDTLLYDSQIHRKALYEALPLVSYPVVFFFLALVTFSFSWSKDTIQIATAVLYPMWSLSAGLQLVIHVFIVMKYTQTHVRATNPEQPTLHRTSQKSSTYFSVQTEG